MEAQRAPNDVASGQPIKATHLTDHQVLAALLIIHRHVQAGTEQVLVCSSVHARAHEYAMAGPWLSG